VYVDPVAEGREYQQLLLRLLGDQDPAEVMQRTPALLRGLAAKAGETLRVRPEPKEWSVFECICHVIDAELVISGRLRFILAQDEPPLPGYDQDLWVDRLHQSGSESIEELMAWFEPLRAANLRLWHETPPEGRARVGIHSERGPESFELTFRLYAGHDIFHIDQATRTLELVGANS
jgi:DinB family protein